MRSSMAQLNRKHECLTLFETPLNGRRVIKFGYCATMSCVLVRPPAHMSELDPSHLISRSDASTDYTAGQSCDWSSQSQSSIQSHNHGLTGCNHDLIAGCN